MNLIDHLNEFRSRLIKSMILFFIVFLSLMPFSRFFYEILSAPLRSLLPAQSTMIATEITTIFLAPFKLVFYFSIFISIPFILFQIWRFISPGLKDKEIKLAIPLFIGSNILFYMGVFISYKFILPIILNFFIGFSPQSVIPMTDINSYLSFCLQLFLVFGLAFEIPIIVIFLILLKIISVDYLKSKRRHIIVGFFFISMFITPPDIFSMSALALMMYILFEIGLYAATTLTKIYLTDDNN